MRWFVASLLAGLAFANSAHADWRFAKWGMTQEELVAAGAGQVRSLSADEVDAAGGFYGLKCRAEMDGPIEISTVTFTSARFCFNDGGRLASVDLQAPGDDFYAIDRALRSAFGTPIEQSDGSIATRSFNDEEKGNSLRLIRIIDSVLSYTPRATGF